MLDADLLLFVRFALVHKLPWETKRRRKRRIVDGEADIFFYFCAFVCLLTEILFVFFVFFVFGAEPAVGAALLLPGPDRHQLVGRLQLYRPEQQCWQANQVPRLRRFRV